LFNILLALTKQATIFSVSALCKGSNQEPVLASGHHRISKALKLQKIKS